MAAYFKTKIEALEVARKIAESIANEANEANEAFARENPNEEPSEKILARLNKRDSMYWVGSREDYAAGEVNCFKVVRSPSLDFVILVYEYNESETSLLTDDEIEFYGLL